MKRIKDEISDLAQKMFNFGNSHATELSKSLVREKGIALAFDINMNKNVNAFVKPVPLKTGKLGYHISMNMGLIINLYILASALLSKSEVMEDLGENEIDFAEGTIDLSDIKWGKDIEQQIDELSNEGISLLKLSPKRYEATIHIVLGAFLFAYFHEMGHARRAHADWYYRMTLDALNEDRDSVYLEAISSQAIELSADAHASLKIAELISSQPNGAAIARYYGFGAGLLFETFDNVYSSLASYNETTHPHPGLRFMYTISGFEGRASKYGISLSDEVVNSIRQGFIEAATSCKLIDAETAVLDFLGSKKKSDELNYRLEMILDELDRVSMKHIPSWLW